MQKLPNARAPPLGNLQTIYSSAIVCKLPSGARKNLSGSSTKRCECKVKFVCKPLVQKRVTNETKTEISFSYFMLRNFEQNRGVCLPSVLPRVGAAVRACSLNLEMDAGSAGSRCALILLPWRPINTRTTLASLLIRAYFLNMPVRAPENRSASGGFPNSALSPVLIMPSSGSGLSSRAV